MTGPVELVVEEPAWQTAVPALPAIAEAAALMALAAAGIDPDRYVIAILACDDARISSLNADFRGRVAATNVLSWPAFDLSSEAPGAPPRRPDTPTEQGRAPLGDIAIALNTCQREAQSAAIPLKNHVTHLILHGCLHLMGYDHQTDADAALMERIESRALQAAGIADPYAMEVRATAANS